MRSRTRASSERRAAGSALRLHGTIARDIGIRIVSGRIAPGRVLNGEIEASERLQVSRTAYREAVRILAAKGLIESRPKLGTRVSAPRCWHLLDPDVISWIFTGTPDERLLHALFELRTIVEPAAAALAAQKRSAEQLQAMRRALDEMAASTLAAEEGREADREFHSILLEASGNPFLASLESGVAAAVSWTTVFKQRNRPLPRDPLPDHERVYEAVASGDAAAAQKAMAELVHLALLDTTGETPVSSRVAHRAKRPSGGSPRLRRRE
ncbi:MAG TPA: FCD domain-containing protein [Steroidobacteraceae bacterium]|jgi:DNA-binding FadR family transcriptional regulator|nr:FCD domain-containing protein [Steroidobacteraceae bacterium]